MTTVFIVGAGASQDFGSEKKIPIGPELAIEIENLVRGDLRSGNGAVSMALSRDGGFNDEHRNAMARIGDGIQSRDSIDDFLSDWDDIPEIGRVAKVAIAHILLEAERASLLGQIVHGSADVVQTLRPLKKSWLGIVANRVNPAARRRDVEQAFDGVAFVTFNYDRCIEQYLLSMFTSTLALPLDRAREALRKIPILHAYGSLGDLVNPTNQVEFGAKDWLVPAAARNIRTYTEEIESGRADEIKTLVESADKLIFLGCAYHKQNLNLLFGDPTEKKAIAWGTTYRMRQRSIAVANAELTKVTRGLTLHDKTCSELLLEQDYEIFERTLLRE